jgi:hypothetical protein
MRLGRSIAMAVIAAGALAACATRPTAKPPEEWARIERVSVVAARFPPKSNFEAFARSYGAGAAKGVAQGTAGGAVLGSVVALGMGPYGIILLPFTALAGAAAGAVAGGVKGSAATVPEDTARQIEAAQERALHDLRLQARLADRVVEVGTQSPRYRVAREGDELGPAAADDKPAYAPLGSVADAVLETGLTEFGFEGTGGRDPALRMVLKARARIVRTSDGRELGTKSFEYRTGEYALSGWVANRGELLNRSLDRGIAVLGEQFADHYLLAYVLGAGSVQGAIRGAFLLEPRAGKSADKLGRVDTAYPVLRWQPWDPAAIASQTADPTGELARATNVRYDVRIWQWESGATADLVYERRGIEGTQHTVENALPVNASYIWSVRVRFSLDGRDYLTAWGGVFVSCTSPAFSSRLCGERFTVTSSGAPPPATTVAPTATAATSTATAAVPPASAAAAPSDLPRIGDRWTYRLSDRGRARGMVAVEIIESSAAGVRERITRDGYPAFLADRRVDAKFDVARFQPAIALPGGYPLWEFAPYFPADTQLRVGQSWGPIPGEFSVPLVGKRALAARVSVVSLEKVSVPAGVFEAWRIETQPLSSMASAVVIKCTYWYSPKSLRTIKMQFDTAPTSWGQSSSEIYELARFDPAG